MKTEYKGFTIEPKRDFGQYGFLIRGRFVKTGWVVVKDFCNPMPGATWFQTVDEAKDGIDDFITSGGDSKKFWELNFARRNPLPKGADLTVEQLRQWYLIYMSEQEEVDYIDLIWCLQTGKMQPRGIDELRKDYDDHWNTLRGDAMTDMELHHYAEKYYPFLLVNKLTNSFKAVVSLKSKGLLLGGSTQHESSPFVREEDAKAWADQCVTVNRERPGYEDAKIEFNIVPVRSKNPIPSCE